MPIPALSEVLKFVRVETEHWFAIAVVSGVLLVLPVAITDVVGASGLISFLRAGVAVVCIALVLFIFSSGRVGK